MFLSLFPHLESMNDNTTIIVSLETEMQLYQNGVLTIYLLIYLFS